VAAAAKIHLDGFSIQRENNVLDGYLCPTPRTCWAQHIRGVAIKYASPALNLYPA